ncbi:efflux transporter, outer membrane factor (OMF) lipoprotein, NodT family [Chitinophaga jiangningensis]|uniref:Efflux transporter, outer membrane factor (OMF) lipoprotein, NodT family n=1 Tax=Chitinophaga jiangningensis TaxID=1419482 RepID=A0A1M7MGL8_9BACT|nr:TolC family protein [Chitinophaga jiangningensis]SHM90030.1 efflux transporter, outer membrane factor (OMF) lipoprotein, NodT family [Chitinophaga jiangningensis]
MTIRTNYKLWGIPLLLLAYSACKIPAVAARTENKELPAGFSNHTADSTNAATVAWKDFFTDPYLKNLIDTALQHNQELNITLQEIEIARNEIRARKGEYLPFVQLKAGAGLDKVGRYTNIGAMEEATEIKPGKEMPDPLPDYLLAAQATWEADIWHKLHNAKKAAVARYVSTVEGRNFVLTNLIAEIANSYYELLALDKQLEIVQKNVEIQSNVLRVVRLQKEATRVTELAVRRFQAQLAKTKSLQYNIQQQIAETEYNINFLLGRYPQPIERSSMPAENAVPAVVQTGIPSQLLANRPDIRKAEQELAAAKLDVKVAKARFYPSVGISAAIGYNAFNPSYLLTTPASLIYSLAGELSAPLVNRNAIRADYLNANSRQLQAVYNYERTVLHAFVEVARQVKKIDNLQKSYDLQAEQVQQLSSSVDISDKLFKAAEADYMEVLMTQHDALEAKFELVETQKQRLCAVVNIYEALGGGWQ